jgi:hypothetical protein
MAMDKNLAVYVGLSSYHKTVFFKVTFPSTVTNAPTVSSNYYYVMNETTITCLGVNHMHRYQNVNGALG